MTRLTWLTVIINGVGLGYGIAGAWLIWRNGLPPADVEEHGILLNSSPDPDVIAARKTEHETKSKRGMLFLVIGFALQFVCNLLAIFQ